MRRHSRIGVIRTSRTISVVLAVMLAGPAAPAMAQEVVPAPTRPLFTQEALRRAAFTAKHDTALPGQGPAQAAPASASGPNRSWDTLVGTVQKGKKLTVTLTSAATVEGKLVAIDARSLTVEQSGEPRTIEAVDVFRVRYDGIRSRRAKWGMLIGASAAAIVGAIAYHEPTVSKDGTTTINEQGDAAAIFAIFFGLPAGAIVGAALPIGPPLYEAAEIAR